MRNIRAMSVAENQDTMSRSNDFRLSNNIEDVIEKLECLQLVQGHGAGNRCFDIIDQSKEVRGLTDLDRLDVYRTKLDEYNSSRQISNNDVDRDQDPDQDQDQDQDDLIERGPIKSHFSLTRDQPYRTSVLEQLRHLEKNDTFIIDCDQTVEQILRDKECREKLNPCLDQLEKSLGRINYIGHNSKNQNTWQASSLKRDFSSTPTNVGNVLSDDLLKKVSSGAFQAAQHVTEKNFLRSWGRTEACFDSTFGDDNTASFRPEIRQSDYPRSANSNYATICAQFSESSEENFNHSPVGSPRVTVPPIYRPPQISCSSSCSSSSSNQSYGDTPSPNSSCQATVGSQSDEGFSTWFSCHDHETISSSVQDNVENSESWSKIMEELVSNLEGERTKVGATQQDSPKAADTANSFQTHNSEQMNQFRYSSTRFNHANSNICSNRDNILVENTEPLACSDGSYSIRDSNILEKELQSIEATNLIATDYNAPLLSDYPKDDNAYSDIGDLSLIFHSIADPSPTLNTLVTSTDLTFDDIQTKKLSTGSKDDCHIPKMVASFETWPRQPCNSDRNVLPWSSLNLPSVKASDKLKEKLNPKEVRKAMISLLKRSTKELAKRDKDGDTTLMCLVANPDELTRKMAYLVPLVERLSTITGALTIINNRGEDALYLAALNCPQFPFVTGYLAATMLQKEIDITQRLYHTRGDTLIHSIAAQGDSHKEILSELLALKTVQGNRLFDLSKRNYDGRTALHVAIESHEPFTKGITSLETVKLLLKYGADPKIKETKCGDNALHMAVSSDCDPRLVKLLLNNCTSDLVNAVNYNHDTALHVAAAISTISVERQTEVCCLLVHAGGRTNLPNREGKLPLDLVAPDKKEAIRNIFLQ